MIQKEGHQLSDISVFLRVNINCTNANNLVFGGIIGSSNNSNMVNCYVFGTYSLNSSQGLVFGGIVGYMSNTVISKCSFNGDIGGISGSNSTIGGVAGLILLNSSIVDCQSLGVVSLLFVL